MQYSEKKFKQFKTEKQNRVIAAFVHAIEVSWQEGETRKELLQELQNCLLWNDRESNSQLAESILKVEKLSEFLAVMIPWEQEYFRDLRDHDFLVRSQDGKGENKEKIRLTVLLHDLRSAFNTGSIIRTAECLGVEKLIFSGYTPLPDKKKVRDTSMGTYEFIEWEQVDEARSIIKGYKQDRYTVYGLETTSHAKDIYTCDITSPALLILGNEALGIPREILEMCDAVLELPTAGWKNSLNVGAAFAAAGYEIYRKWKY